MGLKSSRGTLFDKDYLLSISFGITNWKPSDKGTSTFVDEPERSSSVLTVDPGIENSSNSNDKRTKQHTS
jgi:hypothetical protein